MAATEDSLRVREVKSSEAEKTSIELRRKVVNTLALRSFYEPSPEVYLYGLLKFYDENFGPNGCALRRNVLNIWRQYFILQELMNECQYPQMTPEADLVASGHVDKYNVHMVKDETTGDWYRADHVVRDFCKNEPSMSDVIADLDGLSGEKLGDLIEKYTIPAPNTKNRLSLPYQINLMHKLPSPVGFLYMRPELARDMYMNFEYLYRCRGFQLPFAAAEIGEVFRKKVAPRYGVSDTLEFTVAEFFHFMDPNDKSHPKFSKVSHLELLMLPRHDQKPGKSAERLCLGDAVSKGIVKSQTLAYFIGKAYQFLLHLGLVEKRLRFRQRLEKETDNCAVDCWDAEIECSYGWLECAQIADRSDLDLTKYSRISNDNFAAWKEVKVEKLVTAPVNKELRLHFTKLKRRMVAKALKAMNETEALEMKAALETRGEVAVEVCKETVVVIKKSMVSFANRKVKSVTEFIPHVIEAPFEIGRIIYCLYEHSFDTRDDDKKVSVFRFNRFVAPYKCIVLPLAQDPLCEKVAKQISRSLAAKDIIYTENFSGLSRDEKFAQADEFGVPFVVTVDSTTSVRIRERDSRNQVCVNFDEVAAVIKDLTVGRCPWDDIFQKYRTASADV